MPCDDARAAFGPRDRCRRTRSACARRRRLECVSLARLEVRELCARRRRTMAIAGDISRGERSVEWSASRTSSARAALRRRARSSGRRAVLARERRAAPRRSTRAPRRPRRSAERPVVAPRRRRAANEDGRWPADWRRWRPAGWATRTRALSVDAVVAQAGLRHPVLDAHGENSLSATNACSASSRASSSSWYGDGGSAALNCASNRH